MACCGPNLWNAKTGSRTVLINRKPAHRLGDMVKHCGGMGNLIQGSPNVITGGPGSSSGSSGNDNNDKDNKDEKDDDNDSKLSAEKKLSSDDKDDAEEKPDSLADKVAAKAKEELANKSVGVSVSSDGSVGLSVGVGPLSANISAGPKGFSAGVEAEAGPVKADVKVDSHGKVDAGVEVAAGPASAHANFSSDGAISVGGGIKAGALGFDESVPVKKGKE
jgi:hypothetical protein